MLTLLTIASGLRAQVDITGRWYGRSPITKAPGYHLSLPDQGDIMDIEATDVDKVSGRYYHYYWDEGAFYYVIKRLEGAYMNNEGTWVLKETGVIANYLFRAHYPCLQTYTLKYRRIKNQDSLSGTWTAASFEDCGAGTSGFSHRRPAFTIKGAIDSIEVMLNTMSGPKQDIAAGQIAAMPKPAITAATQPAASSKPLTDTTYKQVMTRNNSLVKTILLQSPVIKIEIWDNGIVDNDNISLYFNEQVVLKKKRITTVALTATLTAVPGQTNELVMYANNLGDIPPNTAVMRVLADGKAYEFEITSDERNNGTVRFQLK